MFTPIHKHVLIKAQVSTPVTDVQGGKDLLENLVDLIGMVPVTAPQAVYVNDLGNEGLTGSINLATSHIAFHVWDKTGLLMMDVYSCKDFDVDLVIGFIDSLFTIDTANVLVLDRDALETIEEFSIDNTKLV